jgi:sugar lactone lactonase YvrE
MRRASLPLFVILAASALVACASILGEHHGELVEPSPADGDDASPADAGCSDCIKPPAPPPPPPHLPLWSCSDTRSDPRNCGQCGHDCLGGTCEEGACTPVALVTGQSYPTPIALRGASLLFANYKPPADVVAIAKDGCDAGPCETLAPTATFTDVGPVRCVATDGTNTFFSNYGDGFARSVNQISPSGAIITLDSADGILSLSPRRGFLFYTTAYEVDAVRRVPVGGGPVTGIVRGKSAAAGDHSPFGIVVDDDNVYWIVGETGSVYQLPHGTTCDLGVDCPVLYADDPSGPIALEQDATNLYVSNRTNKTIKRIPKNGDPVVTLATGQVQVQVLATDGKDLYWGSFGDNTIRRVPVSVTTPCTPTTCVVLAANQYLPDGIAVDDVAVYWTVQYGTAATPNTGKVLKLAK